MSFSQKSNNYLANLHFCRTPKPIHLQGWLLTLFLLVSASALRAQDAQAVLGEWYTEENKAKVEVYECASGYCGRIISLSEPNHPDGRPKLDTENPDASLRNREIVGIDILSGLQYDGEDEWEDGTIYDPESGKTYSCYMELKDDNSLEVRGFIGVSLIGRSQTWTRAK